MPDAASRQLLGYTGGDAKWRRHDDEPDAVSFTSPAGLFIAADVAKQTIL
jgi:hypothetical protein